MRRYFWLIPIFFMVLGVLACDGPSFDPIRVKAVQADPQIPGKAYIVVTGSDPYGTVNEGKEVQIVYETVDYGETWQRSTHAVFPKGTRSNSYQTSPTSNTMKPTKFSWSNNVLYSNSAKEYKALWSFPRSTFRYFFAPDNDTYSGAIYLNFDYYPDYDVSPAAPNVIYISLGTEGVLVGPNPENPGATPRAWKFSHNGIGEVRFLPLTITNTGAILGIILMGLLIPPLSGLHIWILAQVYRYAFQDGERWQPYQAAARVTAIITALAAVAIYIWLTDVNTDYYPIVAIMTVLCSALSAYTGVQISRKRGFSTLFTRRIGIASAVLACLVPAGVASIWLLWPFIIAVLFCFALFRRAIEGRIESQGAIASRWGLDRLALIYTFTAGAITAPLVGMLFGSLSASGLIFLLAGIVWFGVGSGVYLATRNRTGQLLIKKKNEEASTAPIFNGRTWYMTMLGHTALWLFLAGIAAYGVFMFQLGAHNWFQTLLVEQSSRLIIPGG
jgi:hypothetical protein